MGKDVESWVPQQPPLRQFPNVEFLKPPFYLRMHNTDVPLATPCNNEAPSYHTPPAFGYSRPPILEPGQLKKPNPHGCFFCLPQFRQGLVPNSTLHEKFLPKIDLHGKFPICGEAKTPITRAPKQFLVFDHTENKTTVMFSSWSPKPTGIENPREAKLEFETDESDDDHVSNEEGEMHEDSEEIDALLYSDDEDNYSEDTKEASTGHSPSLISAQENKDWFDEKDTDEVASSSDHPVKRQKLSDTSMSVNRNKTPDYEDDAESSCADGRPLLSLLGSKRVRDDKIRETVSILETIIPGIKGSKDAVMVLDEAIYYLRTLKFKAKSLGLFVSEH